MVCSRELLSALLVTMLIGVSTSCKQEILQGEEQTLEWKEYPPRVVNLSAEPRTLEATLEQIGKQTGALIEAGAADDDDSPEPEIPLELKNATLWEALAETANKYKVSFRARSSAQGKEYVVGKCGIPFQQYNAFGPILIGTLLDQSGETDDYKEKAAPGKSLLVGVFKEFGGAHALLGAPNAVCEGPDGTKSPLKSPQFEYAQRDDWAIFRYRISKNMLKQGGAVRVRICASVVRQAAWIECPLGAATEFLADGMKVSLGPKQENEGKVVYPFTLTWTNGFSADEERRIERLYGARVGYAVPADEKTMAWYESVAKKGRVLSDLGLEVRNHGGQAVATFENQVSNEWFRRIEGHVSIAAAEDPGKGLKLRLHVGQLMPLTAEVLFRLPDPPESK
jgi:hypothetical protein